MPILRHVLISDNLSTTAVNPVDLSIQAKVVENPMAATLRMIDERTKLHEISSILPQGSGTRARRHLTQSSIALASIGLQDQHVFALCDTLTRYFNQGMRCANTAAGVSAFRKLDLTNNCISDLGAQRILDCLLRSANSSILSVNLDGNPFVSDKILQEISDESQKRMQSFLFS